MKKESLQNEGKMGSLVVEDGILVYITADGQRIIVLEDEASELLELLDGAEDRQNRLPEAVRDLIKAGHLIGDGDLNDWRKRSMI